MSPIKRHPAIPAALALALLAFLLAPRPAFAEQLWSDSGFYIDMPEGFALVDGDQKTRFAFMSPDDGMEVDVFVYDQTRYPSAMACAADIQKKLGSTGETDTYLYQGRNSAFLELVFALNGAPKKGYGFVCGQAPVRQGTGGAAGNSAAPAVSAQPGWVAMLAYTDAADLLPYADFIFSSLDSFSADKAGLRAPGPVSQYLLSWPAQRPETKTFTFGGQTLKLPWSSDEAAQEAEIAAREFKVLEAYGDEPSMAFQAWARAYRMIYRDAAPRLDRLAIELDRLLPDDPTEVARRLLAWTQDFTYVRDLQGADFVDPLTAAFEARGDCDSRAMLCAIILERRGIDAILMVSEAYSHALLAVDVPGGGQRFPFEGKKWLVGETTAKVGLGMIAADQADWSKWLGIRLAQ